MNRLNTSLQSKRTEFQVAVHAWSESNIRYFAWRDAKRTPYETLIAEVMLKRTTAEAASRVYEGFLEKYPSLKALGRATKEELALDFQSLGLYSQRARALVKLVNYLTEQEDGSIPTTLDRLIKVPGLGNYSARAILSFAYGKPAAVVDANVIRVLSRIFERAIPDRPSINLIQGMADALVPRAGHRQFNFAMLDLGKLICRYSKPICNACPLFDICDYFNHQKTPQAVQTMLSARVIQWRREKGFSLVALAQRAKVSKMTIINIEAGRTIPKPRTIEKLSDALGVPARLLTGEGN